MLYQKYNEIPLQNYLSLILSSISYLKISHDVIIKGLNEEALSKKELKIDLYYLNYLSTNNIN
jgi:hypothetical protein